MTIWPHTSLEIHDNPYAENKKMPAVTSSEAFGILLSDLV